MQSAETTPTLISFSIKQQTSKFMTLISLLLHPCMYLLAIVRRFPALTSPLHDSLSVSAHLVSIAQKVLVDMVIPLRHRHQISDYALQLEADGATLPLLPASNDVLFEPEGWVHAFQALRSRAHHVDGIAS